MEDKDRSGLTKAARRPHPREWACPLSKLFFCWALPIFVKGFQKDLTEEDMYLPLKMHESGRLGDRMEEAWDHERKVREDPSLWRVVFRVFGKEMALFALVPAFMELISKMSQPLILKRLMNYFVPNQTAMSKTEAYVCACAVVLVSLLNVLILHSYMLGILHLGMRLRVATCSLIYRKALRLSKSALAETTLGQMVNIISNDVRRFDHTFLHMHYLWIAPIQIALVLYLLYVNVGYSAMAGVGVLVFFIPVQMYIGKMTSSYRMRIALKTDQRVRLMNEIISGIQVIKMYTWEKPFAKLVQKARKLELHQIRGAAYLKAINASLSIVLNSVTIFMCVLVYTLTSHAPDAQYVYVVTSFYAVLRQPLTAHVPHGIVSLAESNISLKRVKQFLLYDEVAAEPFEFPLPFQNGQLKKKQANVQDGIHLSDVSVKWTANASDLALKDVSFTAGPKELVAVVGVVGSGKTTLLNVILKELNVLKGNLRVSGRISYASQEPWLFVGSIRQNILFGQELDRKRYKEVVRVCALERDLSILPYGDRTIVGERGVMLSGGQKARISLARAIYKDADIYLFDDPLSAVDTHVGKQLFDECISGYLREKCVVLVTHQLQYLKNLDRIYLLENGAVLASGSYAELQKTTPEFVSLLKTDPETRPGSEDRIEEALEAIKNEKSSTELKALGSTKELPVEVKEQQGTGNISKHIYSSYLKAGGSWCCILVLLLFALTQITASGIDYFLAFWVNLEQDRAESQKDIAHNSSSNRTAEEGASLSFTSDICLYVYSSLVVFIVVIALARTLSFFRYCVKASQNLHNNMFSRIVNARMRFFNTNPSGRILNRFSKDMGGIDETLPVTIIDSIQVGMQVLAITIVVCSVNPWILIPTVIVFGMFYSYRVFYLATSRNLKRIEGTTRSPVFSHLTASLQGLATIRAFDAQMILQKEFDHHQDLHSSVFYTFLGCSRTFGFWLDINCVIYVAIVTLSFLLMGTETYGGNVGLAITQSITLTGMLQWGMRQWSELENQMTSVERVVEYTEVAPEPDNEISKPSSSWPSQGTMEFRSVSLRYSSSEPVVLKNLCFRIGSTEKIGVVGRTGAGKSSLITALFRLADFRGTILIDGIGTKDISLNSLRSKISIIPQEPVLFSGTLRKNLDPFEEYDDSKLWEALDEVELKPTIQDLPSGLHSSVTDGGTNFSVGQRQLLCLARAVIRRNKILVLDEATANVDPQTDELIQKTIRKKFAECTVLTIAHRLHTVMDSDKILVMDEGVCVEMDHPHLLLQKKGVFHRLVMQTGKAMSSNLEEIARKNYQMWLKKSS